MTPPPADPPQPGASSDHPLPVRTAARLVRQWIDRLGQVWVEGQIAQLRPRGSTVWLTLRDPDTDLSIPVMATAGAAHAAGVAEGHRVVAQLKVNYYDRNGSLTWRAAQFRAVGVGALMQQLEQLRLTLAREGLFRDENKRPLPFLPTRVGLICGRNTAAQRDVEVNARQQWPTTVFEVREVTVQGAAAVSEVVTALVDLDRHTEVDVIVITRGGGSFEDLLPFSNETLLRAVAAARTPVVSAIGHEEDNPLLDLVADQRASTPTAAGRLVVPDLAEEVAVVARAGERLRTLTGDRIARERMVLAHLVGRPVMRGPGQILADQRRLIDERRDRSHRALSRAVRQERRELGVAAAAARQGMTSLLAAQRSRVTTDTARLAALSPQATLDRGYAIVREVDGPVVTDAAGVTGGTELDIRVARGSFRAVGAAPGGDSDSTDPDHSEGRMTP